MDNEERLKKLISWLKEQDFSDTVVYKNPLYIDALLGISSEGALIYDYEKMAEILMQDKTYMFEDLSEAYSFIDYNTSYVNPSLNGKIQPIILHKIREVEKEEKMVKLKFYIKDNATGKIHEYGTDKHDALRVTKGCIIYENLQNGETSKGDYDITDKYGNRLEDSYDTGDEYLDIGGTN